MHKLREEIVFVLCLSIVGALWDAHLETRFTAPENERFSKIPFGCVKKIDSMGSIPRNLMHKVASGECLRGRYVLKLAASTDFSLF